MYEATTKNQQLWLDHIEAAENSGMSIAKYAEQHDIKAQNMYRWRNMLKSKTTEISTEEKFTRVVTSTPLPHSRLTLSLSDAALEYDSLPDPMWLSRLLTSVVARR